jgi:hypothetical protein
MPPLENGLSQTCFCRWILCRSIFATISGSAVFVGTILIMTTTKAPPSIWVGQLLHFTCLAALLVLVWMAWNYLGKPFPTTFWIAIAFPVVHQIFVWLAWRLEFQNMATSKSLGFQGYLTCFFFLLGGRFVSLLVIAWMDRGSLNIQLLPKVIVTIPLACLGIYAMYSVKRYFGMVRAAGADHFDPRCRDMPLVQQGIFRFTSNGMYLYAFLLFWAIAVGFNSAAALTIAAFSHAYIWVHFFATEKPDMDFLYTSD